MQMVNNLQMIEWVTQHLQLIGWPALCIAAWKVSGYVKTVTDQATKTVGQIDKMATNCFPTMQTSLQNQDGLLHSMDESLKQMVVNTTILTAKTSRKKKA
jgi:hypothetical protein